MAEVEQFTTSRPDPFHYRGFRIHFEYPPIPIRTHDWIAVDDNADGKVVANGRTMHECKEDVDRYLEELEDEVQYTADGDLTTRNWSK